MQKYIFWGPETEPARVEWVFHRWGANPIRFSDEKMSEMRLLQQTTPVALVNAPKISCWLYQDRFFIHSESIDDPLVVKGLIIQMERRKEARYAKARKLAEEEQG